MTVYQINYDLQQPNKDYQELYDAIKQYPAYTHILESCWLVDTNSDDHSDVRDKLKQHIDSDDRLFVSKLSGAWGTTFSDDSTDWLYDHC